ncbi:MAG: DEAD/DEAH box helicase [Nitrospina sp.]|jgi:DEAD/DEAH box helicase domain-containing protein|nr:DEAD/DEAH box helicase [Nitrospina sp.]MBT3413891.1 DEAD/DEAH box helicase [Nitrospina sp.]MBT3856260.1 DEAD/DEAH box helicase [Nitrospina sp.]MBT4104293.1 DEAD/DEAH box helicase [Nitrospina sp.]MBT4389726.1 DEAD/DEAH box helicase [Nitrospina sp.]
MSEQLGLFGETEDQEAQKPVKVASGPRVQYFDLETQKSAEDVGGWGNIHKMGLAVGVVWDSLDQEFFTYEEKDARQLVDKLRTADLAVGFNIIGFDYTVLQPYSDFDLQEINTFDMLVDVKKQLGFRLSLNHLAQHTLNAEKSADGLVSLQWYKEGKISKIIQYCKQDVEITRDLFLFGEKNGYVNYQSRSGNPLKLEVNWKATL